MISCLGDLQAVQACLQHLKNTGVWLRLNLARQGPGRRNRHFGATLGALDTIGSALRVQGLATLALVSGNAVGPESIAGVAKGVLVLLGSVLCQYVPLSTEGFVRERLTGPWGSQYTEYARSSRTSCWQA